MAGVRAIGLGLIVSLLVGAPWLSGVAEGRFDECGAAGCGSTREFYGHVRNEEGLGISGAAVELTYYVDRLYLVEQHVFTDAKGYYRIVPNFWRNSNGSPITYHFEVWLTCGQANCGRWTHTRDRTAFGLVDFVLPKDGQTYFYDFAHFATPGYVRFTQSYSRTHTVRVHCGGCVPLGLGDLDYEWSQTEVLTYSTSHGSGSLARRNWVMGTGVFHTDSNGNNPTLDAAWIYGPVLYQEIADKVPDALGPSDLAKAMPDQVLSSGVSLEGIFEESGSTTVNYGLEVTVGFSFMGIGVSTKLGVEFAAEESHTYRITYRITNTDAVQRTFRIAYERPTQNRLIVHIWRIA